MPRKASRVMILSKQRLEDRKLKNDEQVKIAMVERNIC
jgi:hypothetical protein